MDNSHRHHYVPIFLIKNFVRKNGQILMYDKIKDKLFEANPTRVFLEKDRNTFSDKQGEKHDIIERIYTSLDTLLAPVLRDVNERQNLSGKNLQLLLFLAYLLKWRVPQYDESFRQAQAYFSVDDLGLGIKNGDSVLDIDLEPGFDTDFHQELKQFLLAIQPFRFKDDYKSIFDNSFLIFSDFSSLLGDCPVNEVPLISDEVFEDFVFPLTPNITLVHCKRVDKFELQSFLATGQTEKVNQFIKDFSIARDLSTLALSGRLAGCFNEDYFKVIINGYKMALQNERTKDKISTSVFSIIYDYKKYME
jgi:hypothetical protein